MPITVRLPFAGTFTVTQTPSGAFSHTDGPGYPEPDYWVAAYDFGLPANTPVLAMAPGIVVDYRQSGDPSHGLGSFVTILHNPGTSSAFYATYAHLTAFSLPFEPSDRENRYVVAGERLGLSGNTGSGTGAHLHVQFSLVSFIHPSGDVLAQATDQYDSLIDFNGVRPALYQNVTGAVEVDPATGNSPDLVIRNVTVADPSVALGDTIQVTYDVVNIGNATAANHFTRFVYSTDTTLSTNDVSTFDTIGRSIAPGQTIRVTSNISTSVLSTGGTYNLILYADHTNTVAESNETNNQATAVAVQISGGGGTGGPGPADLFIDRLALDQTTIPQGGNLGMDIFVGNRGNSDAPITRVGFYLSTNNTLGASDVLVETKMVSGVVSGDIDVTANYIDLSSFAAGTYWLFAVADYNNVVDEGAGESNNVSEGYRITIAAPVGQPDLMMSGTGWNRRSYTTGETPDFGFSVLNNGNAAAGAFTVRAYLSTNSVVDAGDVLISERFVASLAAGASSQTFTADLPIPNTTPPGSYYYLVVYDAAAQVSESNETNNSFWSGGGFWDPIIVQNPNIAGSSGPDRLAGTSFADQVFGNDGDDIIKTLGGDDRIDGGAGNDKIIAGGGADILTGGSGIDVFKFKVASDSSLGAAADRITDYSIGGDRMNFAAIDTNAALAGDQGFAFVGAAAFSGGGVASIRYADSGADLLVQADVNGDGVADMEIILQGLAGGTLTAADFVL